MEEKNTDGKRKIGPSIPANYISILQLQERWINEKERKQKEEEEEEERRRKQQVEEQLRIEEDLKKAEARGKREEKRLDRSHRKHYGGNSKKKESIDGGEARFAEKEVPAAIDVDATPRDEGLPERKRGTRKRYDSKKKKKNQDLDVVECGSIATENNIPVKDEIRVYRKKGEKAKGNGSREKAAIETQFENLSIKNPKAQTRSPNHNRLNQRYDLPPRRVRMPIMAASTMVWVKKEQNERGGDGIGSGVKPLNA